MLVARSQLCGVQTALEALPSHIARAYKFSKRPITFRKMSRLKSTTMALAALLLINAVRAEEPAAVFDDEAVRAWAAGVTPAAVGVITAAELPVSRPP